MTQLNEAQLAAIRHTTGPAVVFAGAGSGKTRVIASRICNLIEGEGVPPWEILALTFTNKAAKEMRERVYMDHPEGRRCLISTFHSCCARLLREFSEEIGYTADFTILDDKDAKEALRTVIKQLGDDIPTALADLRTFISMAKTEAVLPDEVADRLRENAFSMLPEGAIEVYRNYQNYLKQTNCMDFADLILNTLILLRSKDKVRQTLQQRFQYILVDEYQDTNPTQFELLRLLLGDEENLFVVGDDDQSIYSWRGATPANIIRFAEYFPRSKTYYLEENYRSTGNIIAAASHLIKNNTSRTDKTLFTRNPEGDLIEVQFESDNDMESAGVVASILAENVPYDDVAIFYRTNSQSRALEEALLRENIPYQIFGALEFYGRAEVKDLVAYLRLIINDRDDTSFRRIINTPTRGIGKKGLEAVESIARTSGLSLYDACRKIAAEKSVRIAAKLEHFCAIIESMKRQAQSDELPCLIEDLMEAIEYTEYLKKKHPLQFEEKSGNILELAASFNRYLSESDTPDLAGWMESITLAKREDQDDPQSSEGQVSLMTLHMAKGLEFDRVYITGVEEGLIPHKNSVDLKRDLEEERRLLYVGITRAKKKLSLFSCERRSQYANTIYTCPSRFLKEIPSRYLKSNHAPMVQPGPQHGGSPDLDPGKSVSHPTYGDGVILEVTEQFGKSYAIVDFFDFGPKKISKSHLEALPQQALSDDVIDLNEL